jgi:RimJ/RimL family protein N-acetyltransferase
MRSEAVNILGKIVILRSIEPSDMDLMREMMNDPLIEKMVVGWAWPVSSHSQEQWYNNSSNNGIDFRFVIEFDGKAVGIVNLTNIDWKNRKATTAIKLHMSCPKRKGIGTDAVLAIERYAFEELQFNRLESSILAYNIPSEKLHLKCGWKIEGMQRSSIYKNNEFHDLKIVGLLKKDYLDFIEKTNYWEVILC